MWVGLVPPEVGREGPGPCSSSGVAYGPWRSLAGRCITSFLPGSLPGSLGPFPMRTPVTGFRTTRIQSHLPCLGYFFKAPTQSLWVDVNFQGIPSVSTGWVQVVCCFCVLSFWGFPRKDRRLHMGPDGSRGFTSSQGYLQRDTGLEGPFFILIGKETEGIWRDPWFFTRLLLDPPSGFAKTGYLALPTRGTHSGWDEASSPTASRVTSILLTRFPCVLDSVFHVTSLDCKSGFGCWGLTLSVVCGTWITALSVQRSMCNSLEL